MGSEPLRRCVETWIGEVGQSFFRGICTDGNHLYVGTNATPAVLIKADISDLTSNHAYTLNTGHDDVRPLCYDGTHVWGGCKLDPSKIVRWIRVGGSI